MFFMAARIVVLGLATACGVLLVGGAVKKVLTDPADDCIKAGTDLASVIVAPIALRNVSATGALPSCT